MRRSTSTRTASTPGKGVGLRHAKKERAVNNRLAKRVIIVIVMSLTLFGFFFSVVPFTRLHLQRRAVELQVNSVLKRGMSREDMESAMDRLDYHINYSGTALGSDIADKKAGYSALAPRRMILVPFGEQQVFVRVQMEGDQVRSWNVAVEPNK